MSRARGLRVWEARPLLLRVARRRGASAEDAEDVVQEAMLRAAEHREVPGEQFQAWLVVGGIMPVAQLMASGCIRFRHSWRPATGWLSWGVLVLTDSERADGVPANDIPRVLLDESDVLAQSATFSDRDITDEDCRHVTSMANCAYVIYTSGSTGRPKGVVLPLGDLCSAAQWAPVAGRGGGKCCRPGRCPGAGRSSAWPMSTRSGRTCGPVACASRWTTRQDKWLGQYLRDSAKFDQRLNFTSSTTRVWKLRCHQ